MIDATHVLHGRNNIQFRNCKHHLYRLKNRVRKNYFEIVLTLLEMSTQLGLVVFLLVDSTHLCLLLHRVSSHHITILLHSSTRIVRSHASLVLLETTSCVLLTVLVSSTWFTVILLSLIGPLPIVILHTTSRVIVSTHGLTWCLHATSSSTASVGAAVLVAILPLDRFHGELHSLC